MIDKLTVRPTIEEIVQQLETLDLPQDLKLGVCTDQKTFLVTMPSVSIKVEQTLRSIAGYGETVEIAIRELWDMVIGMTLDEVLLVRKSATVRRLYRWTGYGFKIVEEAE